ncbi:MAG: hypothetical protein JWN06_2508 [Propionibacteriaceae bacterium]|jgi:CHAD domain-containing protein|nr:hypothetical protein [Propionibacteriaceae bacterium]
MNTTPDPVTASFNVEPGFALPDLDASAGGHPRPDTVTTKSETTYYDTAEKDLHRLGMTLSGRDGDSTAGWLLDAGTATPAMAAAAGPTVPDAINDALTGVRRGQPLQPVLTVTRTATSYRIPSTTGATDLELVDCTLDAATMGIESTIVGWRTIELVGGPDSSDALAALGDRLREAGATDSSSSHLDTLLSLGAIAENEPDLHQIGGLVQAYVAEQVEAIIRGDVGLRTGQLVIHPTRVALRRLRSTLRVFRDLFDAAQAEALDGELRWIALVLGEVRDAEVMSARLESQLAALPAEDVLGPVATHIRGTLAQQRAAGMEKVAEALNDERYLRLLDTLHWWRSAAPRSAAYVESVPAAAQHLKRARRTFHRRLGSALEGHPSSLHRARKAAKRLRYSSELTEPALGNKAAKAGKRAKKMQTLLGEHQDATVSAELLRRLGAEAGSTPGHNGYTYGLLAAHEATRIARVRKKLAQRLGA